MNRLTYIASGLSYTRFNLKKAVECKESVEWNREVFRKLNKDPSHNFGVLYNAWTESNFGPVIKDLYSDVLTATQADSGGLQIVTQGLKIDEPTMEKVFDNQGKYSSMAMSFDEIPLSFSGAKSSRQDLTNRWFDSDIFEQCAKKTGKNLEKQIQMFLDMKSESKPIFIAQGNCYDTYMKWTEYVMSQIPQEHQKYIGGVAMGAAALGHGMLEDIQKAFIFNQLPISKQNNHVHILALGSITRMSPFLVFLKSGYYKDVHVTYDSTSHTCASTMGRVYLDKGYSNLPRRFDRLVYQRIFDDINKKFGLDMTLEKFYDCIFLSSQSFTEKYPNDIKDFVSAQFGITFNTIQNFKNHVDLCLKDDEELINIVDKRYNPAVLKTLYSIKTKADYDYWMDNVSKYVESKRVSNTKTSTLDDWMI